MEPTSTFTRDATEAGDRNARAVVAELVADAFLVQIIHDGRRVRGIQVLKRKLVFGSGEHIHKGYDQQDEAAGCRGKIDFLLLAELPPILRDAFAILGQSLVHVFTSPGNCAMTVGAIRPASS